MRKFFVLLWIAASGSARADAGDAWAYARTVLPAETNLVVAVNVEALRRSAAFGDLYASFLDRAGRARETIASMKSSCGIELRDTVQGMVVAWTQRDDDMAFYIAAPRLDAKTVTDCARKVGAASAPDAQGIVELSTTDKDKLYVAFPKKNVLVIASRANRLARWLGAKGVDAGSDTARAIAKVQPGAAMWGVIAIKDMGDVGARIRYLAAQAQIAGGKVQLEMRFIMAGPKDAENGQSMLKREVEQAKKDATTPREIARALETLQTSLAGDEVVVKASLAEADLVALIRRAME